MNANANSSLVSPRPPNSSGIDQPNVPSRRISSTMSWGTWSPASTRSSFGIATSLTKRRVAAKSSSIAAWSRIIVAFLNLIRLLKRTTPCERPSIQQAIMLQPDIYLYPSAIQRSFHPSPHEATRPGSGSDPRRVAPPRRRRPALLAVTRRERKDSNKRRERFRVDPCRPESIDDRIIIREAERHAAHELLVGWNADVFADRVVIVAKRGLRTGLEPLPARRQHDRLDEHSRIEPASEFHIAVECEE